MKGQTIGNYLSSKSYHKFIDKSTSLFHECQVDFAIFNTIMDQVKWLSVFLIITYGMNLSTRESFRKGFMCWRSIMLISFDYIYVYMYIYI